MTKLQSLLISFKKSIKIVVIFLVGVIIAGLEVKYPTVMGYTVFNQYTIGMILYIIYDFLKHNWITKLP
jgi:hypothetical protein